MSAGEPSFLLWLREVVQPQADPRSGNAAALDDFSPDGMREYCYPKELRCPATPICGRFQAPTQKGGISAPTTKFGFSGQRLALVRESPPAVLPKPKYGAV